MNFAYLRKSKESGDEDVPPPILFHSSLVTSDLAPKIKLRDYCRGPDGWVNPHRRAAKCFVVYILVCKFFDI
jgi:hypothetical protein